jgi:hypothetical protein
VAPGLARLRLQRLPVVVAVTQQLPLIVAAWLLEVVVSPGQPEPLLVVA